jgi:hypothetical protein
VRQPNALRFFQMEFLKTLRLARDGDRVRLITHGG